MKAVFGIPVMSSGSNFAYHYMESPIIQSSGGKGGALTLATAYKLYA